MCHPAHTEINNRSEERRRDCVCVCEKEDLSIRSSVMIRQSHLFCWSSLRLTNSPLACSKSKFTAPSSTQKKKKKKGRKEGDTRHIGGVISHLYGVMELIHSLDDLVQSIALHRTAGNNLVGPSPFHSLYERNEASGVRRKKKK